MTLRESALRPDAQNMSAAGIMTTGVSASMTRVSQSPVSRHTGPKNR